MTSRCLRCERFKRPDGIQLCPRCAPVDDLRQDVTIHLGHPLRSRVRATVKPGRRRWHLRADQDRGRWNHDRQAFETRDMVVDRATDYYAQAWRDPKTEEITWGPKRGRLSDPDLHGRGSYRLGI